MSDKKIRFLVLGYGHIGRKHAAMVAGNPDAELVGIVDLDPAKAAEARETYSIKVLEQEAVIFGPDGFQENEVDVVCVCTPNGLHADQSIRALGNKWHVVIEKPMGLTRSKCEDVIFKSLQVSRHVFCVKQNRYSPTSVWLRSLIDENRLGEINMVQLNCYWNRDDRYYKKGGWKGTKALDGGVLFTQFSHFIDIMYWLFGDIDNIRARFVNFNHGDSTEFIDTGVVSFDFINGGMGSINFSTSIFRKNMESSITIIGSKGSVKVSGQYMDSVEYVEVGDYDMPQLPPPNPPNDYGDYKGSAANHHYVIQNVIDVLTGKAVISTNALEGMKVVEIIERIHAAGESQA
ncbi:MAG: Gfo/Idh/MocA family protein [Salibacteraceae bacterium]